MIRGFSFCDKKKPMGQPRSAKIIDAPLWPTRAIRTQFEDEKRPAKKNRKCEMRSKWANDECTGGCTNRPSAQRVPGLWIFCCCLLALIVVKSAIERDLNELRYGLYISLGCKSSKRL